MVAVVVVVVDIPFCWQCPLVVDSSPPAGRASQSNLDEEVDPLHAWRISKRLYGEGNACRITGKTLRERERERCFPREDGW